MKSVVKKIKKPFIGVLSALLLATAPISTFAAKNSDSKTTKSNAKSTQTEKMPDLNLSSEGAFLYDMNLKKVIYEKNADEQIKTASLAKVMNLYLASDALASGKVKQDDEVPISVKAWQTGGSRMFVEAGRKVPFGELFKGVAVVSGNDAAVAIAEYLAGSTDAFVQKMNQKAASLGMTNTHYRSVNGLPEGDLDDLSTPRDLGKLATSYIQKYPGNLAIHSLKEFAFDTGHGVIKQQSENPLLGTYPGADGLKTGYIDNTYNLIGTAQRDGVRLVLVTMKAPTASDRAKDAKTLMDYGFAQYGKYTLAKKGDKVTTIPVYKAKSIKKTDVFVKDDAKVIVHSSELKGKTIKKVIKLPEYLNATNGFKAGDKVGEVQYYIGKKLIAHEDLVVHDNIEKGTWWQKGIDSLIIFGGWVIGLFRR